MNYKNTFFYLDDDPDDLSFFEEALDTLGGKVKLFRKPELMLTALEKSEVAPDIIFLDLNMPNFTGFDIIKDIRNRLNLKELPIVIYSTAADSTTIRLCRESGASLYLTKPTSMSFLQRAIKYVMDINWKSWKVADKNFVYLP